MSGNPIDPSECMPAITRSFFVLAASLSVCGAALGQNSDNVSAAPASGSVAAPVAVIRHATAQFIDALDRHKAQLGKNPQEAVKLVQQYLLPYFDLSFTSRLVLGRYWSKATPGQRKAFTQAFIRYLTTAYAKGIANYRNAKVQVLPFHGNTRQQFVSVDTLVHIPNQNPITVDYALHKTSGGWKAFDVKVQRVSFVLTYRNEYQAEIKQTSLAALIKRIQNVQSPKKITALKAASSG